MLAVVLEYQSNERIATMTTIAIKEPYADQVYVLNEDNEFECEHEITIERDSFSHDAYPNAVEQMIWAECEFGCELTEREQDKYIEYYYDNLNDGGY